MIVPCSSAISWAGKRGQTQKIKIGPTGDEKGGLSTGGNKTDAAILWWGGANANATLNSNPSGLPRTLWLAMTRVCVDCRVVPKILLQ
jgi:hypothetical protein